ncbi:MAG: hypothetical protein IPN68_18355 [Bacteroidetes bacterium]|nr:hypothetical protein [Bacteroidota bacterium]
MESITYRKTKPLSREKYKQEGLAVIEKIKQKEIALKPEEEDSISVWNSYVARARSLVKSMAKDRLEIGRIASEACEIVKGGGGHWSDFEGVNTLKKFAKDVGIHYKTLHRYVSIHKNIVLKVPDEKFEDLEFSVLNKICRQVNAKTSPEVVKKVVEKEKARDPRGVTLYTIIRNLKTARYYVTSMDLKEVHSDDLAGLETVCDDILSAIKSFKSSN